MDGEAEPRGQEDWLAAGAQGAGGLAVRITPQLGKR